MSLQRSPAITRSKLSRRQGFTLVELLVVIAIIGVLVALLLPAVQAAREAARRAQCQNNLKQLGLATLMHVDTHKFFPSGGWSKEWLGDSNRGFGESQPGSWCFSVLPYLEQSNVYNIGSGLDFMARTPDVRVATISLVQSPVTTFYCPSRRPAKLYNHGWNGTCYNCAAVRLAEEIIKTDYAANSGDGVFHAGDFENGCGWKVPRTYEDVDDGFAWTPTDDPNPSNPACREFYMTGIVYQVSEISFSRITDGSSNTYFAGEKYINPEAYDYSVTDFGENQSAFTGFEWDNTRVTHWDPAFPDDDTHAPRRDRLGLTNVHAFGSSHPAGLHMVLCDGSVKAISYDIDRETHRRLGNRMDELPIDLSNL